MRPEPLTVAVTGGIGSGKSQVAELLGARGARCIDADDLAREALAPGTPGLKAVIDAFGSGVLDQRGELDRSSLASVVFADTDARRRLEAIVHPEVARRFADVVEAAPPGSVIVYEIPLLVEAGREADFDVVVVVDVSGDVQRERLIRHRGLTAADADARIAAQVTRADRLAVADLVVDNSGSPDELAVRVAALWRELATRR